MRFFSLCILFLKHTPDHRRGTQSRNPQSTLRIPEGVAPDSPFVQILDPATGTATFLVEVIEVIHCTLTDKWKWQGLNETARRAAWNEYVPQHLLPRLHGYELMMAPYAIAHMKLPLKLKETGFTAWDKLGDDDRARIYLTNALEPPSDVNPKLPEMFPALAHEAQAVNEIKRSKRFTVVIGNPPYSSLSQNLTPTARQLIERYKYSGPQNERIIERGALQFEKNLQDDYIKFFAKSQDILSPSQMGVLCLITNHGFLGNPTLRGFRWSVLRTFTDIWLLDLHGNINRKEVSPDGSVDQNVFDIKDAGVAILLGVVKHKPANSLAQARHKSLWGSREHSKYPFLFRESIMTGNWRIVSPTPDFFILSPRDVASESEYNAGIKLTDIYPLNSLGTITARDKYVVGFDKERVLERALAFQQSKSSDEDTCKRLGIPLKKGWNVARARKRIQALNGLESYINIIQFRPFDNRYIFYHDSLVWSMAKPVMRHMLAGQNIGIITNRQVNGVFRHVLCSRKIINDCTVSSETKERSYFFPVYLHPGQDNHSLWLFRNCRKLHNIL